MLRHKNELHFEGEFGGTSRSIPERAKLSGANCITPLWHPEACAGLSGLFAIINGIRLALAETHTFPPAEIHALVRAGLSFMSIRLTAERAMLFGLRVSMWRALAEAMVAFTRHRTGAFLSVERLLVAESGRKAAFDAIEQAVMRLRVPVMLCRGGHYTVVSGFTRSSLLLCDSRGAHWKSKRATGVPGDCQGTRHVIYPSSFLALVA